MVIYRIIYGIQLHGTMGNSYNPDEDETSRMRRDSVVSIALHAQVWNISLFARSARCPTALWIAVADKPLSLSVALQSCFCLLHNFIPRLCHFLASKIVFGVTAQLVTGCQHRLWPGEGQQ